MSAAYQGSPDWQGSVLGEDVILLPAFGDDQLHFAIPRKARLARRADGSPQFFLEFFSDRNDPRIEDTLYAVIDLGLECSRDLSAAYELVAKNDAPAALMPATFTTGTYCHFECGDAHVTLPFAWQDVLRATLHSRIPVRPAQLIYGALAKGAAQVARAAVECGMGAFLPRLESTVSFQVADLLAAVAKLNPGGGSVAFQRLVKFFDDPPGGLLRFEGNDRGGSGRSLGLALAGRVRHYFGRSAPCPMMSDGPHIALKLPDGAPGAARWDLRTPLFTEVPIFLDFDPFTPIVNAGDRQRVTGFTSVPKLPDDLKTRRITIASGLPPGLRDCKSIDLSLRVDKAYAVSGATSVSAFNLYPGEGQSDTIELQFKSVAGPKPVSAQIIAVCAGDVLSMPWFDCDSDYLFIESRQLPGTCVTVQATAGLLSQAAMSVAFKLSAVKADAVSVPMTAEEPAVSYLLQALGDSARIIITARDPRDPRNSLTLDLPCRSVTADLASFRGYGPQTTSVEVRFAAGQQAAQLEFLPELAAAPIVLEFSTAKPQMRFSYFATDIFRNRYRFRRHSSTPGREAPWSDYRPPREDLFIDLNQHPEQAPLTSADGNSR